MRGSTLIAVALVVASLAVGPQLGTAAQHEGGNQTDQADGQNDTQRNETGGQNDTGNQNKSKQAQDRGKPENPSGQNRSAAQQAQQRAQGLATAWDKIPEQAKQAAAKRATQAGLFGVFNVSAGQANGSYLTFDADASAGTLSDVTVHYSDANVTVYDELALEPWTQDSTRSAGTTYFLIGADQTLAAHDNPNGLIRVAGGSNATSVSLDLADDVNASKEDNRTVKLTAQGHHVHVFVAGQGNLTATSGAIDAQLDANATLMSMAHPTGKTVRGQAVHERVDAYKNGKLGGEVAIVAPNGTPVADRAELSVAFDNVTKPADNRTRVTVTSQNHSARTVTVSVDVDAVNLTNDTRLKVWIDGKPASEAVNATALLNDPGAAKFNATVEEGAAQLTISVPGFSTRELTFGSVSTTDTTTDDSTDDTSGTNDTTNDTDGTDGGDGTGDGATDGQNQQPAPGLVAVVGVLAAIALARRKA